MARFENLPPEILHQIMYEVQPDDIENLVLTSKHFYFASNPVLAEHRELKRRYTTISHLAKVPQGEANTLSPVHHLPHLLKSIVESPRIGLYIKKIMVRGIEESWFNATSNDYDATGGDVLLNPRCSDDDIEFFKSCASPFSVLSPPHLSPPCVEQWYEGMEGGNHAAFLSLIMLHSPNLRCFDFEDRGGHTRRIFDLFEYINIDKGCNILNRLEQVRLEHTGWGNSRCPEDINRVKMLLGLPAMKSIEAHHLDEIPNGEIGAPMPYRSSDIQSLTFTHCKIYNKSFFELLEATRQLQSLIVNHTSLDNYWIKAALIAFTKDSLKHLSLHSNGTEDDELVHYIGPLKPLAALQTLDLDDTILVNPKYDEIRDLEAHLPASIQSLILDLGEGYIDNLADELVVTMNANAEAPTFPHLRNITLLNLLAEEADEYSETLAKVSEGLARQGVAFHTVIQA